MISMFLPKHLRTIGSSKFGLVNLILALLLVLSVIALPLLERFSLTRAGEQGHATLRLAVGGLQSALDRFEPLPGLIGERPLLSQVLNAPDDAALVAALNESLRLTAEELGASDIYLMDTDGLTLASSNYLMGHSFIGRSFTFRPYFTQALEGTLGRFFALGTTSRQRGYFFAAPVRRDGDVRGVVALKFTVDEFEAAWRGSQSDILVTDDAGVIFMASRPAWQMRTLGELDPEDRTTIIRTRQYPLDRLQPLNTARNSLSDDLSLIRIEDGNFGTYYVASDILMDDVGWRATILSPAGPRALSALMMFVLSAVVLGWLITTLIQRQARIRADQEAQKQLQDLLERRVAERTADLNDANANLLSEVEERRAAEQKLRKTQKELVQAGKLAALGQMSAALSHEINQPLAAVKSYADNAATFLDRDRPEEARENVNRISQMADRMAAISGHLRNFARRPRESVGPVEVLHAMDDALALMDARFKSSGTEVVYEKPDEPIWVMGGQLRLQQVIINLFNNAIDAMEETSQRVIEIEIERAERRFLVHVRDKGTGLSEDMLAQVFDPFFTTKSPGKGLGLGLSISYNILEDFGGHLRARNRASGGAEFSIELPMAEPSEVAAE